MGVRPRNERHVGGGFGGKAENVAHLPHDLRHQRSLDACSPANKLTNSNHHCCKLNHPLRHVNPDLDSVRKRTCSPRPLYVQVRQKPLHKLIDSRGAMTDRQS